MRRKPLGRSKPTGGSELTGRNKSMGRNKLMVRNDFAKPETGQFLLYLRNLLIYNIL